MTTSTEPAPTRSAPATIWIVNPYGTLPSEGWRDYRSAMLARALAQRGHQVRWWISDIEHRSKQRRRADIVDPLLSDGVTIEMVRTRAYHRNMSLGRIRYEQSFAAGFAAASEALVRPDLIVLADPSLFFAGPVVAYARRHGVPFVLDVLDLWPELFHLLLPKRLRHLGRIIFGPLYRRRERLVAAAAAVVAVTSDYIVAVTARQAARRQLTVYLGVDRSTFPRPGPPPAAGEPLHVVYAGTLGDAYDLSTVITAIDQLASRGASIFFTIAGDGPWREQVRALALSHPDHLRFLGIVPAADLAEHYAAAHVGLASYAPGSTVSMPVKIYDYLASGLATVGSMGGEAAALLVNGAGQVYAAGNADDLVTKLLGYREDPASLQRARQHALTLAANFDQETQHDRFAALIEEIITGKKV